MSEQSIYEGIKHVAKVTTFRTKDCQLCGAKLNDFEMALNHYVEEHDFKILHIGTEATTIDGELDQETVAVVGTTKERGSEAGETHYEVKGLNIGAAPDSNGVIRFVVK